MAEARRNMQRLLVDLLSEVHQLNVPDEPPGDTLRRYYRRVWELFEGAHHYERWQFSRMTVESAFQEAERNIKKLLQESVKLVREDKKNEVG